MDRYDDDRPSIFSRPDDDDVADRPTQPADRRGDLPVRQRPRSAPPDWGRDVSVGRERDEQRTEGPNRQVLVMGGMGVAIVLLLGFVGFLLVRSGDAPVGAVEPTASASASAEPSASPSPSASASAEPTAAPTPAGPPAEVAVGGWAAVTVDELNVRSGAGPDQAVSNALVRGAIVNVVEGPTAVDGGNWYRVASLGGASGWASSGLEDDPFLESIGEGPTLNECGDVRRAVFDVSSGAPVATDPLRIGDHALPVGAFDDVTLAAMELIRGMGAEVCFTVRLLGDGSPELSTQLNASACGHATTAGSLYRLEPIGDDGDIPLASQVVESTLVHPTLLEGGPADNRMSSNLRTVMSMLTNEGSGGCLNASVTQRGEAIDASRSINVRQCSVIREYNQDSLRLSPSAGGPEAWIRLSSADYEYGRFSVEQTIDVSIDAYADESNRGVYAWPYGSCG